MSDELRDLEKKLREAQVKVTAANSAVAAGKRQRIQGAIWAAIGGFMLFAIGGHWFPGYQLDSSATASANASAEKAIGSVMVELCAERFMSSNGFDTRVEGLEQVSSDWKKTQYIRQGSWAERPDGDTAALDTAEKCLAVIAKRMSKDTNESS